MAAHTLRVKGAEGTVTTGGAKVLPGGGGLG